MKIAAVLILAGLVSAAAGVSPALAQQCRPGSYPALDDFGNKVCKRLSDGDTVSTQVPRGQVCPAGAYPTLDSYGNRICRSEATPTRPRTDYYDTSKGCPTGSFQTLDSFGNKVCKAF